MIGLRDYQTGSLTAVLRAFRAGERRVFVQQATGTGKTVVFARLIKVLLDEQPWCRVLVLVHRDFLIEQTQQKLLAEGIETSREQGQNYVGDRQARVVVASIATISQKERLLSWSRNHFAYVIADECHRVASPTWRRTIEHFAAGGAKIVGYTATPNRTDKEQISEVLNKCIYKYSTFDATADKHLVPAIATYLDVSPPISIQGDTDPCSESGAMHREIEPYLREIADLLPTIIKDRTSVVFAPMVKTSKRFVELLCERGIKAVHIDAKTKPRDAILSKFRSGEIQVISNASVLTEGYDNPRISAIVMLRYTESLSYYVQMVGRGLRPHESKTDCLIIEPLWQAGEHDICSAHILEIPPNCDEPDGCGKPKKWRLVKKDPYIKGWLCTNPECKHGVKPEPEPPPLCPNAEELETTHSPEMQLISHERSNPYLSQDTRSESLLGKEVRMHTKKWQCPECGCEVTKEKEVPLVSEESRLYGKFADPYIKKGYTSEAIAEWKKRLIEQDKKWRTIKADHKPTEKQLKFLQDLEVEDHMIKKHAQTKWEASILIDRMVARRNAAFVSPPMLRKLKKADINTKQTLITWVEAREALKKPEAHAAPEKPNAELSLKDL